jgi:hypothetical protein
MQTLSGIRPCTATIELFEYFHLLEVRTPSRNILHMPSILLGRFSVAAPMISIRFPMNLSVSQNRELNEVVQRA